MPIHNFCFFRQFEMIKLLNYHSPLVTTIDHNFISMTLSHIGLDFILNFFLRHHNQISFDSYLLPSLPLLLKPLYVHFMTSGRVKGRMWHTTASIDNILLNTSKLDNTVCKSVSRCTYHTCRTALFGKQTHAPCWQCFHKDNLWRDTECQYMHEH